MSPRGILWRAAAVVATGAAALGLRGATVFELTSATAGAALVRLSWSARPERVERCRRLSDDELAQRPVHMRLRMECEGTFARYLLTVLVDGNAAAIDTIRGGGLRHDRPMHVFREIEVTPGWRRIAVSLARIDAVAADSAVGVTTGADTLLGAREIREMDERRGRAAEAIPDRLELDTALALAAGRVLLVTWDRESRRFIGRSQP